jgi:hypothetical protein
LSLSSYSSADPSSLGSVVRGSSAGRSGHCCDYLLEVVGPSRLAPIRPYDDPLHWSSLPGPQGDDLMNYGALGPFVRSFILLVDPGDICPPHGLTFPRPILIERFGPLGPPRTYNVPNLRVKFFHFFTHQIQALPFPFSVSSHDALFFSKVIARISSISYVSKT